MYPHDMELHMRVQQIPVVAGCMVGVHGEAAAGPGVNTGQVLTKISPDKKRALQKKVSRFRIDQACVIKELTTHRLVMSKLGVTTAIAVRPVVGALARRKRDSFSFSNISAIPFFGIIRRLLSGESCSPPLCEATTGEQMPRKGVFFMGEKKFRQFDANGWMFFQWDCESDLYWGASYGPNTSFLLVPQEALALNDQLLAQYLRNHSWLIPVAQADLLAMQINGGAEAGEKSTISQLTEYKAVLERALSQYPGHQPFLDAIGVLTSQIEQLEAKQLKAARIARERRNLQWEYNHTFMALGRKYGFHCLSCKTSFDLEIDHIVPLMSGGRSVPENLQLLCEKCNSTKGTQTIDYRPSQEVKNVC